MEREARSTILNEMLSERKRPTPPPLATNPQLEIKLKPFIETKSSLLTFNLVSVTAITLAPY